MSVAQRRVVRLGERPSTGALSVTSEAMPQFEAGDAVVRIHATSLNYHDYLVVAGHIPQPASRIPMSDGAGEVVALGAGCDRLSVGDRVIGAFFPNWLDGPPESEATAAISGETVDGFAADHVVVPAASLVPVPEHLDYAEAATLPCAGLTAWRALMVEANLQPGQSVLLPGSGGLSVFCLQICVAAGIRAIVTSSSEEKLGRLREMGAGEGVNYRLREDWSAEVKRLTNGRGVDAALEIGGDATFDRTVDAVCDGGRIMVVGTTGNQPPALPLRDIVMRHIRLQGMAVGNRQQMLAFLDFVSEHRICPVIDRTFPIDKLGEAFEYQLSQKHFGKIVVTL